MGWPLLEKEENHMTKMQRLQWENERMKKALEEIHAMCIMTGEEREKFLEKFEYEGAQFYPIALGTISFMTEEALTAVEVPK